MSEPPPRRHDALAILMPAAAVYVFASCCLVALAWDGSGYLFQSLQNGEPDTPHHRYSNYPMLALLVQARALTGSPQLLAIGYGLLLSLTPLLSLVACLRLLRTPELAPLRVWPVLGILLGSLPGEICLMSEASLATQAFWPLVAFAMAGVPWRGAAWMAVFVPWLFFLHPTAVVMLGVVAALCLGMALMRADRRRAFIAWACAFAVLAVARLALSMIFVSSYERTELAWKPNWDAFLGSIWGWTAILLSAMYAMGFACVMAGAGKLGERAARRWILWSGIVFAAVGLWWASDSIRWNGAISYRRFVMACALPLVAMGAVHWWALRRGKSLTGGGIFRRACIFAVWVFVLVYAVQAWTWRADIARLEAALRETRTPFITSAEVPWIRGRPMHHWGTTMLSIIMQGREPHTIFAVSAEDVRGGDIELFPGGGGVFHGRDGWFRIDPSHRASRPRQTTGD